MKSRLMIVFVSFVCAAVATFGVAYYIAKLKSSVTEGQRLVDVVIAKKTIEEGYSVAELFANGSIAVVRMPKQYIVEGAIKSVAGNGDKVIGVALSRGDQVTGSKFKRADEVGLAQKIPDNMMAVSVAVDEVTGVGGRLKTGDRVDVLATVDSGTGDDGMTKIMLQDIEVIAVPNSENGEKGNGLMGGQQTASGKRTITLAVYPYQTEKLVFASEKGHIWLGLRCVGNRNKPKTAGQTIKTLFN